MTLVLTLDRVLANARFAVAAAALAAAFLLAPASVAADETPPVPPTATPPPAAVTPAAGTAGNTPTEEVPAEGADEAPAADAEGVEETAPEPEDLAGKWGIEVTSIRLTANNHMIDFRYRVLDPVKAKELFVRQNKPALIHQATGKVLAVPATAKVGPLRNSDPPKQGKIYWMFFGNAGYLVKAGDKVSVVIGTFRVDDLVVE
jgi:hypothetical protein